MGTSETESCEGMSIDSIQAPSSTASTQVESS